MSANHLVVVGIGASAGGLEALQRMVSGLHPTERVSYVVVQHLSPSHESMLVKLVGRDSQLDVREARDGQELEPDVIYITPPNNNVVIEDYCLRLERPKGQQIGPKPSVDLFFTSLAENLREQAVGIILSGTGSDGSTGIRAIKAEGGFTIAQDPQTAKYDGMPLSAINTQNIDLVIPPERIGHELGDLLNSPRPERLGSDHDQTDIERIISLLYRKCHVDFSDYKLTTISRRIQRRMIAQKISSQAEYLDMLEGSDREVEALFNDILISVTGFFRDKESFEELRTHLEALLKGKKPGQSIRVWTVGCSTGEEAYSMAILLSEILGERLRHFEVQIFATDIDQESMAIARRGVYSEASVRNIDQTLLDTYFNKRGNAFEVIKPIRSMVIFSHHDLTQSPPFLRLDLISCRNVFIYFTPRLQNRILPIFHYALNIGGLMFLGKSESLGECSNFFATLSARHKIFQARRTAEYPRADYAQFFTRVRPGRTNARESQPRAKERSKEFSIQRTLEETALDAHIQRAVVVDEESNIVYVHGNLNPYLELQQGEFRPGLNNVMTQHFSIEYRSLMQRVLKGSPCERSRFKLMHIEDEECLVRICIQAMTQDSHRTGLFLVTFLEVPTSQLPFGPQHSDESEEHPPTRVLELEQELASTKEHLQTVIEELETSNEELQSLNEELQSSNEELQSSNEELETTNEELQSTNEELQTAYAELRELYMDKEEKRRLFEERTDELAHSQDRLVELNRTLEIRVKEEVKRRTQSEILVSSIFDSTDIGICITGPDARYVEVNPAYTRIYGYSREELVGQSFTMVVPEDNREFALELHRDFIAGQVDEILSEWIVQRKDGSLADIYVTANLVELDGTPHKVTTVADITQLKQMRREKEQKDQLLSQQSKLAAMGEMVGAIAHQWRQPLNIIGLLSQTLMDRYEDGDLDAQGLGEHVDEVMRHLDYLSQTIDDFRNFLAPSKAKVVFDLRKALVEVLRFLGETLAYAEMNVYLRVDCDIDISEECPDRAQISRNLIGCERGREQFFVLGYPNEFKQAIINFIQNAKDAYHECASENRCGERTLMVDIHSHKHRHKVRIRDHAGGMPAQIMENLFQPYATTKKDGTGLGLYMAHTIITKHMRGDLVLQNHDDGTDVLISLPRAENGSDNQPER